MNSNTIISRWLMAIMSLIIIIIVVGAITRLTNSGLSMPFWDLIEIFPPISESDWDDKFEEYKNNSTPDSKEQSISEISDFKTIFWWEYIHRILGRIIGLAALIPLAIFIYKGYLNYRQKRDYGIILLLIITQGIVGWLMVKSGLNVDVYNSSKGVSPFWLLIHLSLAFSTFCYTLFQYLKLKYLDLVNKVDSVINPGIVIFLVIFIQILLGALMSGFKAAYLYPSFPLMEGEFYSSDIILFKFDNLAFINFAHRWFAFIVLATIIAIYYKLLGRMSSSQKNIFAGLLYAVSFQIGLGILSLLNPVIPFQGGVAQIVLAVFHQFGAIILLSVSTILLFSFNNK